MFFNSVLNIQRRILVPTRYSSALTSISFLSTSASAKSNPGSGGLRPALSNYSPSSTTTNTTTTNSIPEAERISTRPAKKQRDILKEPNLRAYYVAKKINVSQIKTKMFPDRLCYTESDCLVVSLSGPVVSPPTLNHEAKNTSFSSSSSSSSTNSHSLLSPSSGNQPPSLQTFLQQKPHEEYAHDRYAVFFDYGAIVFLNCDSRLQQEYLRESHLYSSGVLKTPETEDFALAVDPNLEDWSHFCDNQFILQRLDLNNIRVSAAVIGQAVAMSHFENKVDELLDDLDFINDEMARLHQGGIFSELFHKPTRVYHILGEANDVLSSVIVRLAILNRTKMRDTAWRYAQYHQVWEGLRKEFEFDVRWDILDTKIGHLQHHMRFIIEGLQASKSERLEWLIIMLIAAELGISIYHVVVA